MVTVQVLKRISLANVYISVCAHRKKIVSDSHNPFEKKLKKTPNGQLFISQYCKTRVVCISWSLFDVKVHLIFENNIAQGKNVQWLCFSISQPKTVSIQYYFFLVCIAYIHRYNSVCQCCLATKGTTIFLVYETLNFIIKKTFRSQASSFQN